MTMFFVEKYIVGCALRNKSLYCTFTIHYRTVFASSRLPVSRESLSSEMLARSVVQTVPATGGKGGGTMAVLQPTTEYLFYLSHFSFINIRKNLLSLAMSTIRGSIDYSSVPVYRKVIYNRGSTL